MAMELSMWTCRCGSSAAEEKPQRHTCHIPLPCTHTVHIYILHTCATHHTIPHHIYTSHVLHLESTKGKVS